MKSLSGKFVLITVLLQLFLSVLEVNAGGGASAGASASQENPQFGDLINFPRAGLYSHYGIYVGGEDVKGKKPDDNIFEMTKNPGGCQFIKIEGILKIQSRIYDRHATPQDREQMKATIEALMKDPVKCKKYSLTKENCEIVATKVRYNKAMCKQEGTAAKLVAGLAKPRIKRQKNKQKRREAPAAA